MSSATTTHIAQTLINLIGDKKSPSRDGTFLNVEAYTTTNKKETDNALLRYNSQQQGTKHEKRRKGRNKKCLLHAAMCAPFYDHYNPFWKLRSNNMYIIMYKQEKIVSQFCWRPIISHYCGGVLLSFLKTAFFVFPTFPFSAHTLLFMQGIKLSIKCFEV